MPAVGTATSTDLSEMTPIVIAVSVTPLSVAPVRRIATTAAHLECADSRRRKDDPSATLRRERPLAGAAALRAPHAGDTQREEQDETRNRGFIAAGPFSFDDVS